jgi:hypothetical protein
MSVAIVFVHRKHRDRCAAREEKQIPLPHCRIGMTGTGVCATRRLRGPHFLPNSSQCRPRLEI